MSWTHSKPIREEEGRRVARLLGVPQENLTFFGATDASVCDEITELLPKFQKMMEKTKPDRVCCGAFEQGHLDHDATNFLVNATFKGPVLEIPFYHTYLSRLQKINRFSDPRGQEIILLDENEQLLKKSIARQYPSQNIWSVLLWYEAWQVASFKPIVLAKSERMRLQIHRDFRSPNHPKPLARRIIRSQKWRRWRKAMRMVEATKTREKVSA